MEHVRTEAQQCGETMKTETRYILMGAVVLVILAVLLAYVPGDNEHTVVALNKLKIATGFILLALIFLFGFAVLVYIANGSIDLSDLLSETGDSKGASMSRFQLLIFTLVIALSLFLVVVSNMKFPDTIPPEILTLLGISASTYAVSKGIQVSGNQASSTTQSQSAGGTTTTTTTTPGAT
jgi:amino acid transporter